LPLQKRSRKPFFSILIPAHNEAECIVQTCEAIIAAFTGQGFDDYEILVVNDHSTDDTELKLQQLSSSHKCLWYVNNSMPNGFGFAVRFGLERFRGDAVCITMADASDSPADIVRYYQLMMQGYECVWGSRFVKGSKVIGYPGHKLVLNRVANQFVKTLFRLKHNDLTNAFKCYHRKVITGIQPLLSNHFNITVELPLKAIVRGYTCTMIPISWQNRKTGISKLVIREMGSRYLFIVLYCLLERLLSSRDYFRRDTVSHASRG
jgi:dolichol-phosphate mannosyltransferase